MSWTDWLNTRFAAGNTGELYWTAGCRVSCVTKTLLWYEDDQSMTVVAVMPFVARADNAKHAVSM